MPVADLIQHALSTPAQRKQQKAVEVKEARRRGRDKNGKWLPTALEITEAHAYNASQAAPDDAQAAQAHRTAWNALYRDQAGDVSPHRCVSCGLKRWGRLVCVCGEAKTETT